MGGKLKPYIDFTIVGLILLLYSIILIRFLWKEFKIIREGEKLLKQLRRKDDI